MSDSGSEPDVAEEEVANETLSNVRWPRRVARCAGAQGCLLRVASPPLRPALTRRAPQPDVVTKYKAAAEIANRARPQRRRPALVFANPM